MSSNKKVINNELEMRCADEGEKTTTTTISVAVVQDWNWILYLRNMNLTIAS